MLKKLILPILVLSTSFININALDDGDVRIEANLFEANDRERVSIFSGSVKITKAKMSFRHQSQRYILIKKSTS